jgi:hypothetical protein
MAPPGQFRCRLSSERWGQRSVCPAGHDVGQSVGADVGQSLGVDGGRCCPKGGLPKQGTALLVGKARPDLHELGPIGGGGSHEDQGHLR